MEPTAPVLRRRFRLSVRALMALILVIAVALGWYLETVRNQQKAVAAIRQLGSGQLHTSVSVRDCSHSSIVEALAAISAAPVSAG